MKILIGKVLKPQGINGELKISNLTDGFNAVKDIENVYIDGEEYKVLELSVRDNAIFMFVRGVFDRNQAETFRGKEVYCERDELNKADDAFYIEDIIGCEIYLSSGKKMGTVKDVQKSSVDLFVFDSSEGEAVLPFLKDLQAEIDIENKKITVNAKRFTEVVFYRGNNED